MMLTGSIIPPEPPVPWVNTGWVVLQEAGLGDTIFLISADGVLTFNECHVMNKRDAQRIFSRLKKQGLIVKLMPVAEYKRMLVERKLAE